MQSTTLYYVVISRKWCKTESLLLDVTNRDWYTVIMAATQMTLRDLQDHSPTASLFKCCVAYDKISIDTVRRAVPLQ